VPLTDADAADAAAELDFAALLHDVRGLVPRQRVGGPPGDPIADRERLRLHPGRGAAVVGVPSTRYVVLAEHRWIDRGAARPADRCRGGRWTAPSSSALELVRDALHRGHPRCARRSSSAASLARRQLGGPALNQRQPLRQRPLPARAGGVVVPAGSSSGEGKCPRAVVIYTPSGVVLVRWSVNSPANIGNAPVRSGLAFILGVGASSSRARPAAVPVDTGGGDEVSRRCVIVTISRG
jgi:hypothetical protein